MIIRPLASNSIELTTEKGITYIVNDAHELGISFRRKDKEGIKVSSHEGKGIRDLGTHRWVVFDREGG